MKEKYMIKYITINININNYTSCGVRLFSLLELDGGFRGHRRPRSDVTLFLNHFPILVQIVPFFIIDFTFLIFIRKDPQEVVTVSATNSRTLSAGFLELAIPSPVIPDEAIALAAAEST